MSQLFSAAQVREFDRIAIEERGIPGLTLMRRAAHACVTAVKSRFSPLERVAVYCGSGNNAGDGYIIAGMLADSGVDVTVVEVGDPGKLGNDAKEAYRYCKTTRARWDKAEADVDLIVDALLGTGLQGDVRPDFVSAINEINAYTGPVLSVDIPSGLCADTGTILGECVCADVTVTFIARKRGLFTHQGPDVSGEIVFDPLAIPADIVRSEEGIMLATSPTFERRRASSYKNSHGHVLVVGGNHGMGGAALMASEAALRTGAGLVSVATRDSSVQPILVRRPEVMAKAVECPDELTPLLERATTLVLGPGLGRDAWADMLMQQALASGLPMVIDADGLFYLSKHQQQNDDWVLTPHPGEASTLLAMQSVQPDRFAAVTNLQSTFGGSVVLKGAGSLIHTGRDITLCPFGNPGMATAGMGDVLSGVIGGLLAQGHSVGDAAVAGVCVHALAGDMAAGDSPRGLAATDLMPFIRSLVNAA